MHFLISFLQNAHANFNLSRTGGAITEIQKRTTVFVRHGFCEWFCRSKPFLNLNDLEGQHLFLNIHNIEGQHPL